MVQWYFPFSVPWYNLWQISQTSLSYGTNKISIHCMQAARHAMFSNCALTWLATTVSYARKMFVKLTPGQRSRHWGFGLSCSRRPQHCARRHRFRTGVWNWKIGQGILKGEVSLWCWPVWLVWNQLYDNWQFLFLFAKPVKQEVNGTMILPPLVFPGLVKCISLILGLSESKSTL